MNVEPNPILPIFQRNGWVWIELSRKRILKEKGEKKKGLADEWLNANWENSKGTSKG